MSHLTDSGALHMCCTTLYIGHLYDALYFYRVA
jgi:hypothetical protein